MRLMEKLSEKYNTYSEIYFMKLLIFLLLFLLIIESILVFCLATKKTQIAVITDEGLPLNNYTLDSSPLNLINTEQFILYFLNQIYNYNKETYSSNIRNALGLMTSSLKEQYLSEIQRGGYIEQVEEYSITSSLSVKRINEKDITGDEKGYYVKVNGTRLNVVDFISRNIDVEITIGFKETRFTKDNIWGLEVFYIKEEVIK